MLRILVIFFCLYFSFNFSFAQEQESPAIEEIIVNADYRLSDLNDIPSSVIVRRDSNLNRNAQHLGEYCTVA